MVVSNQNTVRNEYVPICTGTVAMVCSARLAFEILSSARDVLFIMPLVIVCASGLVSYVFKCEAKYKWLAMLVPLIVTAVVSRLVFGLPVIFR